MSMQDAGGGVVKSGGVTGGKVPTYLKRPG